MKYYTISEKKRRAYDQFGRDGVQNGGSAQSRNFRRARQHEDFDFAFPHFVFRDPEDVFREFFGGADPFEDLLDRKLFKALTCCFSEICLHSSLSAFGLLTGSRRHAHRQAHASSRHAHHHPYAHPTSMALTSFMNPLAHSPFAAFGFGGPSLLMSSMMGGGFGMSPFGGGSLFDQMETFSSSSMFAGPGMSSSSTSTRFINGKKVTTKTTVANGVETVKTFENDVLVSHTVNGEPRPVENGQAHAGGNTFSHNGHGSGVGGPRSTSGYRYHHRRH
jgi:DnaJ family protein B protein 6